MNNFKKNFVTISAAFAIMALALPCQAKQFTLSVSESITLNAPSQATVRIASRKILKAIDEGPRVKFVAMAPGNTTVVIGSEVHRFLVVPNQQSAFMQALQALIETFMGLKVEIEDGNIVVAGQLLRFNDWLEIAEVARSYRGKFYFQAVPTRKVADEAVLHFQKLALENRWPHFKLTTQPELIATLPPGTKGLQQDLENALSPFGIQVKVNHSQVDIQPLVRTHVILAEVTKDFSQEFGVEWPSQYAAQIVPRWQGPASVLANLKTMESQGLGKVLAAPVIVCRSGSEAAFHAGGEFPIKIINRQARDVVWKKHGVILNVKPRADYQGSISLEIETEISLLDLTNTVDGIPALKTNRVKSHFDITANKTIALSGLIRQDWGDSRAGLAGLSSLPILGPLFGSQKFLNHQTELVIFVTPELTNQSISEKIEMPKGWTNGAL